MQYKNICDHFTRDELVMHLGVSKRTASRYINGASKPRPAELRLLKLIHKRRIMPESWPDRIYFTSDKLQTPHNNSPLTWQHVEQYHWSISMWWRSMSDYQTVNRQLSKALAYLSDEELKSVIRENEPGNPRVPDGPHDLTAKEMQSIKLPSKNGS